MKEVRKKIKEMELKGDVQGQCRYEAELSALEAEHVTGLKPVMMGRGGGRGRTSWSSRGGASGRGRGKGQGSTGRGSGSQMK